MGIRRACKRKYLTGRIQRISNPYLLRGHYEVAAPDIDRVRDGGRLVADTTFGVRDAAIECLPLYFVIVMPTAIV